ARLPFVFHRLNLPWPACPLIQLSSPPQCGFRTCYAREWCFISLIGGSYVAPVHPVSRSAYCLLAATSPGWRSISRRVILSASTTGWTLCVLHCRRWRSCVL